MFLDLLEQDDSLTDVTALEAYRIEDGETIVFEGVKNAEEDSVISDAQCPSASFRTSRVTGEGEQL